MDQNGSNGSKLLQCFKLLKNGQILSIGLTITQNCLKLVKIEFKKIQKAQNCLKKRSSKYVKYVEMASNGSNYVHIASNWVKIGPNRYS